MKKQKQNQLIKLLHRDIVEMLGVLLLAVIIIAGSNYLAIVNYLH